MTSFRITLKPNRRAAARFVVGVRRTLQKALADEQQKSGLTQTAIANMLGVHRSVINREIKGTANMTLGRVAELAWAMGLEPHLELKKSHAPVGQNTLAQPIAPPISNIPFAAAPISSPGDVNARLNQLAAA